MSGTNIASVERTLTRIRGFANAELDFQLMRSLGAANYGGGTPGEIFQARGQITGDDPYSWPSSFDTLAQQVEALGEEAEKKVRLVTAREHLLRSSMYRRAAEYFSDPFDSAMVERGLSSRRAFLRAIPFMEERIFPLDISFDAIKLPGYFLSPKAVRSNAATVLLITGFDRTGAELYFQAARAGLDRGFNIVIAEGPGQVGAMRLHPKLAFRSDYEVPIAAMIDAALTLPEVDPQRFALYGISFGGYFVIRAAEHDPRIKALIANSPIVDLRRYLLGFVGDSSSEPSEDLRLSEVDSISDELMPPAQKLSFKGACRRFGVSSYFEWIDKLQSFNALDQLSKIVCPTLAMVGSGEGDESSSQFDIFCSSIKGCVTRHIFDESQGADMHCQVGNLPLSNSIVF